MTIHPGDQKVPIQVSIGGSSSYTQPVTVTVTGLPSGITVTPFTTSAGGSGTLYLSAAVNADQESFPANADPEPDTATSTVQIVAVAGVTQSSAPLSLTVSLENPAYQPETSALNLPVMNINTNGTAITSKTVNVSGTVSITSSDGQTSYLPNSSDSDNTATFHVHGNSTALMPKLPYEMKLGTSVDLLTAMGLSCPYVTSSGKAICDKSKTYVLLANYDDKTLLRDWAASALANAIPMGGDYLSSAAGSPTPSGTSTLMPWAPHSLYVELYLNGEYEGTYQLIEKVNVDSHRINITELTDTDTSGDLSGGYQMEIDQEKGEDYNFVTPEGVDIGMVDPDFTPEVPEQEDYITSYVDTAEDALFSSSFTDATTGWRAYFDEAAAVNFYIVNDLMGNVDGGDFYSSDYFYKAADNPLIYMGPIWDFDISSGNINYSTILSPAVTYMQTEAPWYAQWFKDPAFKADVATQWNALKNNGVLSQWLTSISTQATALEQAQTNNFLRWPMVGIRVWPNALAMGSYDSEVSYMTNWIKLRMGYLDAVLNDKSQTTTTLTIPSGTLRQGTPTIFTANVTGSSTPTGEVYLLSNQAVVGVGTLDASGSASISTSLPWIENSITGATQTTDVLEAVYVGDDKNALSASGATSVSVLVPLISTTTALANSASITDAAAPATFTVSVVANSGTTIPSGTVSLNVGGTLIASATLSAAGTATFSPSTLPGGVSTLQAIFSGNSTFATSTSNTVTVTAPSVATPVFSLASGTYTTAQTVTITDATSGAAIYYTLDGTTPTTSSTLYSGAITLTSPVTLNAIAILSGYSASAVASANYDVVIPDFTLAVTPATTTFSSSEAAKFTLTLTPENGFNSQIAFTCSGLLAGDSCTFSPSTVTPGSTAVNVVLTLSGSGSQTAAMESHFPLWTKLSGGVAVALLFWPFRRRKVWAAVALFFLLAASLGISGCSSPKGFVLTVTASGGGVSHSSTIVVN
ncbi:CotH kinase family protein [Silvibacterium sp.]|uniref:CotH kinase family protein n=1 Tax=Silvibacterium sp. TaxID=1964179 RepID=UPI0039E55CF2